METIGLAEEIESKGVVANTSKDICVVSVDVNGVDTLLPFGKKLFYTWGNQCEGDMTNILEEGTEVNVCYTKSDDVSSATVVWIGEKPDVSNGNVEALVDVYNQKGTVNRILEDGSFTVESDTACTVVVKFDVFFREGSPSKSISVGESVTFDAVPLVDGNGPSGTKFQATCAWVGQTPGLADRFGLHIAHSSTEYLEVLTADHVFGTVTCIPNDTIAFAYVHDAHEKVMLLRSSFNQKFERIQDAVEVGDRLWMRLQFSYIFSGCRQWFAEKAGRYGEVDIQDTGELQRPTSCFPLVEEVACSSYDDEAKQNVLCSENSKVLYSDPPLEGIFNFVSKSRTKGLISYGEMKIAASFMSLFVGDGSTEDKVRMLVPNSVVNFEAVLRYPEGANYNNTARVFYEAVCVWIDRRPSLAEFAGNLVRAATTRHSRLNQKFYGTVRTFYLPDIAVVDVQETNAAICLHRSVLAQEFRLHKDGKNLISDFIRWDDIFSFNVTQHPECGDFLCARNIKWVGNVADKMALNIAQLGNCYSCVIKEEFENDKYSPESDDVYLALPYNGRSSCSMLRENSSLPGLICGAIPKIADVTVDDTVGTSKDQYKRYMSFSKNSLILWNDPPLTGVCGYLSDDKPILVFKKLRILFRPETFFIDGHLGTIDGFMALSKSKKAVKFEASNTFSVLLHKYGVYHRTDLVWVGERPSLLTVAQTIGSFDKEMLATPMKTFIGIVHKYYLLNMAVIKVKNGTVNSVVCLDTESFIVKPQYSSLGGINCIRDFVKLQDKVEFEVEVKDTCPLMLRACNARKLTKNQYDRRVCNN